MKKLLSFLLFCMLIVYSFTVSAYKIGDVVGYALTTDIAATINGYDIPSYNVDGYTYIVVEDLRYYGFSVIYDNSTRSLSVTRDFSQNYVSKVYQKPYIYPNEVGKVEHKILFTDITTYLDGNYVHTYNINGQTIIRFDALAPYGSISYDNNIREISATIANIATNPNPTNRTGQNAELLNLLSGTWVAENESYYAGIPFMDFHGNNLDRGWSYEYFSKGTINSVTYVGNNTYKLTETLKVLDYSDEEYGKTIINEFHIYYEGGNRFKETLSTGIVRTWKYVGTIEDMLNMHYNW